MNKIIKTLLPYVIILLVVIIIKIFIATPVKVNGTSMSPTLNDGDIMILNKTSYWFGKIKRFDIVVVNKNVTGKELIKRVIGLPGEKIEYKDGKLLVNDVEVDESFNHKTTDDFTFNKFGVDKVPDGYYFVVGDNRTDSYDSRYFGFVKKSAIEGKTKFALLPITKLGTVD